MRGGIAIAIPDSTSIRVKHDSIGSGKAPAPAYSGVHTLRAVENLPIAGKTPSITSDLIVAMAAIKEAAAHANCDFGLPDSIWPIQFLLPAERPHLGYRNMGRGPVETVMSFGSQEGQEDS